MTSSTNMIMITRPAHQAVALTEMIQSHHAAVFLFPTIEIIPRRASSFSKKESKVLLKSFDIAVFISANAIEHGLNLFPQLKNTPLLATIGDSSAQALNKKIGRQPDITPSEQFNSEGLLACPALQDVSNKHIIIVRGNGGREVLKEELERRGAEVCYIEAYQRAKAQPDIPQFEHYLQNNSIEAIVITSAESLRNLVELTPQASVQNVLKIPLIIMNQRLVAIAKELGFTQEQVIAKSASDQGIVETLKEHKFLSSS
ncbi:MAG: uroporphyrinogen-III synthase [Woeseiaceae bacterium]